MIEVEFDRTKSWGRLSERQQEFISRTLAGQEVTDLGCGFGSLAIDLLRLGASRVVAIDSLQPRESFPEGITFVRADYNKIQRLPTEIVFLSWPSERGSPPAELLVQAPMLVYLGKNTDNVICGDGQLWRHMLSRPVLAYVPDKWNSLLVYGPTGAIAPRRGLLVDPAQNMEDRQQALAEAIGRRPMGEEFAAVWRDRMWAYEQVCQLDDGACELVR